MARKESLYEQEARRSKASRAFGKAAEVYRRVQAGGRTDDAGRPLTQFRCRAVRPANALYRWKAEQLNQTGPVATSLEARVRELESELHRVERERDILKKALAIFGRNE